jgi:integrase
MGTLRQRSKRWQGQVIKAGFPPQAKTFDTKSEAQEWITAVEAAMNAGTYKVVRAAATTVRALVVAFEKDDAFLDDKGKCKPERKREWLRLHHVRVEFGSYDPRNLTGAVLNAYLARRREKGNTSSTIRKNLYTLQKVMEWGRRRQLVSIVPKISDLIKMPDSGTHRERRLEANEEPKLWRAIAPNTVTMPVFDEYIGMTDLSRAATSSQTQDLLSRVIGRKGRTGKEGSLADITPPLRTNREAMACVLLLALETGCRLGELLTLRWEFVDTDSRSLHLPRTKSGKPRNVPLTSFSGRCLDEWQKHQHEQGKEVVKGRLFPWKNTDAFERRWRCVVVASGLPDFRFHDLRHEAISRFFERTRLSDTEIASIVGHTTTTMLLRYMKLRGSTLAEKLW